MSRHAHYEELKLLARQKRAEHRVDTAALGLREVRAIYKAESIVIDYYPLPYKIKALYIPASGNLINRLKAGAALQKRRHVQGSSQKDRERHAGARRRNADQPHFVAGVGLGIYEP